MAESEAYRAWYAAHREKKLEYAKQYYEAHKEQRRVHDRDYYLQNKTRIRAYIKQWKAANPDKKAVSDQRYYQRHKLEICKKSNERARQSGYVHQKRWLASHKEEHSEATREWAFNNKARRCQSAAIRKARERNTFAISIDYELIMQRDKMMCGICHKKVTRDDLHFDHRIPLAKGGPHVAWNIQVTHSSCNLRKQAKIVVVQMQLEV